MTFETVKNGGRTIMGNTAQQCAKALTESGADIIGTNCGNIDPFEMAEIISILHQNSSLPIIAQPNAGKPQMVNKQTVFKMSPTEFANGLQECLKAGAQLVGGCCGTTPAHIQAAAELLGKKPHNNR
jgi:5-methyltetrahydrofolate--homocysteine methyltransferase